MTKAESYIYNSPLWRRVDSRPMDHKSHANVIANIYVRVDDETQHATHRLVCYSYYGDSILWEYRKHDLEWGNPRNVEQDYDTALKELV